MKIAVGGCGALGSFYGARLLRGGSDVRFLLRSDYDVVSRKGLRIRSYEGDFHCRPKCYRDPAEIGRADLVIIGLKATANQQFESLLNPLVGPDTAVLTLQNGLGNTDTLASLFAPGQILGGLCFVCLNRIEPGVVDHIAHGRITMGEYQSWPIPRTHDIALLFKHAGIPCQVLTSLEEGQWEKLVWNIPFNGLGVAGAMGIGCMTGDSQPPDHFERVPMTTKDLLDSEEWSALVKELMMEIIGIARAHGHSIKDSLADKMMRNTREMGAYKASTTLDFEKSIPMELEAIFLEPLRRAREIQFPCPILERLCKVLDHAERAS